MIVLDFLLNHKLKYSFSYANCCSVLTRHTQYECCQLLSESNKPTKIKFGISIQGNQKKQTCIFGEMMTQTSLNLKFFGKGVLIVDIRLWKLQLEKVDVESV